MSFTEKITGTTFTSKITALSGLALITAAVLAVPAARISIYFFPPQGLFAAGVFFLPVLIMSGSALSLPFAFGLYGTLGFWEQRKVLLAFLLVPTLLLYLFWQWPNWLLLQEISL